MHINLLILSTVIWICGWLFFHLVLQKRKIDYIQNFQWTMVYFIGISLMLILLNKDFFTRLSIPPFTFLVFVLLGITNFWLYRTSKKISGKNGAQIFKKPYFLQLDSRYLVSKPVEILYQQIGTVLLFSDLVTVKLGNIAVITIFAVLFGLGHVFLLRTMNKKWTVYFILSSLVAGVLFSWSLLAYSNGFIYNYLLHWAFYTFTIPAYYFWSKKRFFL